MFILHSWTPESQTTLGLLLVKASEPHRVHEWAEQAIFDRLVNHNQMRQTSTIAIEGLKELADDRPEVIHFHEK